ncbi:MAG: hydroxysqualene dehydroxylase HpnE [Solirubrobacteraceae bacterium]
MSAHTVVIGGGLAGIAAALDCARAGAQVTLLEARGRLGGSAYSFERGGLQVDNGQHVFLRCCSAYRGLLTRIGATGLVSLQPRLDVAVRAPDGRQGRLARNVLPAPLHLAGALWSYPFLSHRETLSLVLAMRALSAVDVDDPANDRLPFQVWLARYRQHRAAIASVWDLIARPTVNLAVAEASLAQVAQVFQVGLLSDNSAGDIGWAQTPLSEIHDRQARSALERAGVAVRLRSTVRSLTGALAVSASDGFDARANAVILAIPPSRAQALIPPQAGVEPGFAEALGSSAIVNLHVVYDRRVMDEPFFAGVGTPVQWVFDRTRAAGLGKRPGERDGQYLAVSLSAANAELHDSADTLRKRYLPALAELLPRARQANVEEFFVTREHAATFRAAPGARAHRPGPRTAVDGLLLAGAYTDTGWPATMEGAVRSGRAAAAVALQVLGASAAPRGSVGMAA